MEMSNRRDEKLSSLSVSYSKSFADLLVNSLMEELFSFQSTVQKEACILNMDISGCSAEEGI